jgi:hypothetical protein
MWQMAHNSKILSAPEVGLGASFTRSVPTNALVSIKWSSSRIVGKPEVNIVPANKSQLAPSPDRSSSRSVAETTKKQGSDNPVFQE